MTKDQILQQIAAAEAVAAQARQEAEALRPVLDRLRGALRLRATAPARAPRSAPTDSRRCCYCDRTASVRRDRLAGPAFEHVVPQQPFCRFCAHRYGRGPTTELPLTAAQEQKRREIDRRLRLMR